MKKILLSLLALILVVGNFYTFTSTDDAYGQGRIYETDIKSTTLDAGDTDTLTFNIYPSTKSVIGYFSLWVLFDSTKGNDDSMTVDYVEMVTGADLGEDSRGVTNVFSQSDFLDSTWYNYVITPNVTKTLRFLVKHTGASGDTTTASLKLVYQ